jgi:uncharacterized membrane protein
MNERIKELIDQCINERLIEYDGGGEYVEVFDKEKFAELIVQECIQVCKSRVGNSDYTTGRMHCVSDLKEHFGVEE